MKGHVSRRGKSWAYWFDIEPDPLTGRRRQQTKSGFESEKEAWRACRDAMADHDKGRLVRPSRRKVADAMTEWLMRIEHSLKPSMVQNWRNYAAYYVVPYIGDRPVQDIDCAVCDALYARLLTKGRVKARPKARRESRAVHARRLSATGRVLPCRPYRYDEVRCYRQHAEDDPLLGQPITARPRRQRARMDAGSRSLPSGLDPKTVVNTHRMLHRAWADFTAWAGSSATSSQTHIRRVWPARGARSGRLASSVRSCSGRDRTVSSRCGC